MALFLMKGNVMPMISISDSTFAKLKLIAEPFVDTPESVVTRLIDAEIAREEPQANGISRQIPSPPDLMRLNPDAHDSLHFTRVLSASINGREINRPKWNSLMDHIHILGHRHFGSFEALKAASSSRIRAGRYEADGFRYLADADLSIQGVDANSAWDHCLALARALAVPIRVEFEWRDNEGAAHAGKRGLLEWAPRA